MSKASKPVTKLKLSPFEKLKDQKLKDLLDDTERVLGNLCIQFEIEGEERDVWHRLQEFMGMSAFED